MACNDKEKGLNRIGQAIIGPSWHFIISVFQFISRPRTWMNLLLIYFKFRIIRLLDVLSKFPDFLAKHHADLFLIIRCGKKTKIEHTDTRANNFNTIISQFHAIIQLWKSFRISTSHVSKTPTFRSWFSFWKRNATYIHAQRSQKSRDNGSAQKYLFDFPRKNVVITPKDDIFALFVVVLSNPYI